jgi:aryl-alcohol dehydrogenase-like predicted oxidoreductase
MGIIAKRPIANGAWGVSQSPSDYADEYFRRAQMMAQMGPISNTPGHRILLSIGFALAHDEVDTIIVGTRNPDHMRANINWLETELPLPSQVIEELYQRFDQVGQDWVQKT